MFIEVLVNKGFRMAELSKTNYLTWFKFQIDLSLLCIVQLERGDGKEGGGGPKEGKGGEVEDPQRGNGVVEDPPPLLFLNLIPLEKSLFQTFIETKMVQNCVKSVDVKCVD